MEAPPRRIETCIAPEVPFERWKALISTRGRLTFRSPAANLRDISNEPHHRSSKDSAMIARLLLLLAVSLPVVASSAEPFAPKGRIALLEGEHAQKWESWLKESKRDDPQKVFVIKDGVLHVSGEGRGYVATPDEYRDYHLTLEYKWGEKRSDTSKYVRNSGVLLHAVGEHGNANPWMTSIEVQLAQGCEGDFIVIPGKDKAGKPFPATITSNTRLDTDKRTRWDPNGQKTVYSGKQFWWSKHDPTYEELLDTRGRFDVASKLGEWTKVECICRGDRITIKINGQAVNECYDVKPSAGRILLQNEGYEVFFRGVVIEPVR
jgi:hypothetical protein